MKATYKTGYKIVAKNKRKLVSFIHIFESYFYEIGCVQYRVKEWIRRKEDCGPLCVFQSECYARDFIKQQQSLFPFDISNICLYKCKYVRNHFDRHLWIGDNGIVIRIRDSFPVGTIFTDKVMLVERLM